MKQHLYTIGVEWVGNNGEGTKTYRSYRRDYNITSLGKQNIAGSSDPSFRGDPTRYNPEELLVASLSSCHMLSYLHVCSSNGISVVGYTDSASGTMEEASDGSGAFVSVLLRPAVTIAAGSDSARALALHAEAHRYCYIARSVQFPVDLAPVIIESSSNMAV